MSSIRMRRWLIVGALAAATVAAPAALTAATGGDSEVTAAPRCLAWFGNKEDGKCLSYSNGVPVVGGTPAIGIGGPAGIYTGPLLPGTTITQPIG